MLKETEGRSKGRRGAGEWKAGRKNVSETPNKRKRTVALNVCVLGAVEAVGTPSPAFSCFSSVKSYLQPVHSCVTGQTASSSMG